MANLKENNYHNLKIIVNRDDYWDFFINKDAYGRYSYMVNSMYDKCLISYIDTELDECVSGNTWLFSTSGYSWESAYTTSYTLENIGMTGVDNGLITFRKDRISNSDFLKIYQESKYDIEEGDNRLKLHAVSGNTLQYDYPLSIENKIARLNGGFFQGFFKTECDKYYILPSNLEYGDVWEFEFVLNKSNLIPDSDKTLNDKYPENKGIFFYIGARAENKWVYYYNKTYEDECKVLSPDDYVEDAHVDQSDYIIGNFFDVDPEFYDDVNFDDYTNYNYYDDSYYEQMCDIDEGLSDYIDIEIRPKIIDETLPHEVVDCFCCKEGNNSVERQKSVYLFNRACRCCSCGCTRIKKSISKPNGCLTQCDTFGDDYIDDFGGLDDGTEYIEPEIDISDFEFQTSNGFSIKSGNDYYFYTDNKFLLFNRTCTGFTVSNWKEGTEIMYYSKRNKFKGNLFILMNRTCTGYNVNNISDLIDEANNHYDDLYNDIYNNALAFRITDKGEIGYRLLTYDCEISGDDKTSIIEGYSFENVIKEDEWTVINVKLAAQMGQMKLYFYVNGKLVYITRSLPKLNLRALNDIYEKQEGVPFNISLGGGTQGLIDTIMGNYMLNIDDVYPLEKYFAGTFIGYMKSFKFYNCGMEYMYINNNYKYEIGKIINKSY